MSTPMRKLKNEELGRPTLDEYKELEKLPVVLVLDNVRSQNNVGSIFRTADAFLVDHLCLCGITPRPPHREIHKTALGAEESVQWKYYKETLEAVKELKADNYRIIAVEQTEVSVKLWDFQPGRNEKIALIFGHEIRGVDQKVVDHCDQSLEIPQSGTKHSLNIAVSAGAVLWRIYSGHKKRAT